jgi:tetratricopeptide (TPR) repeat protein
MHMPLLRRGHLVELEAVERLALAATERLGDVWGQARLHRSLAAVYIARRSLEEGEFHLREGLKGEVSLGNLPGESNLTRGLVYVFELQERYADALEVLLRLEPKIAGLTDFGRANHWGTLGRIYYRTGDSERAMELCSRARAAYEAIPQLSLDDAMCSNYETLGALYLELGRYSEAVVSYEESVRLNREMHHTHDLCEALILLAKALNAGGDGDRAEKCLLEADSILGQRTDGAAIDLRARLEAVRGG